MMEMHTLSKRGGGDHVKETFLGPEDPKSSKEIKRSIICLMQDVLMHFRHIQHLFEDLQYC